MTSTLMNELFTGYCYNGLGLQTENVSLKTYILHMASVIDNQCKILDLKGTFTGNTWVDDISDIMDGEINACKLHFNKEAHALLDSSKIGIMDIICELLNKKYQVEYDDSKSHFKVNRYNSIEFNTVDDSDNDSDSD